MKVTRSPGRVICCLGLSLAVHMAVPVEAEERVWTNELLGTRWIGGVETSFSQKTELVLLNRWPVETEVLIQINSSYGVLEGRTTIPAMSQRTVEITGMSGPQTAGTIRVQSKRPIIANGYVVNTDETTMYGRCVLGQPDLKGGEGVGWLAGLRQLEGRFRSDILLTNPDCSDEAVPVEITLYATDGRELVRFSMEVENKTTLFSPAPIKQTAGRPDLAWGYARIEGCVLASASVVDLRTGDATTVPMITDGKRNDDESAAWQRWLEIAASCDGRMNSSWHTDLIALNPGEDLAHVDLVFHAPGGATSSRVAISGSNQAVFQDVVGLLGSSGKGLLEIRSDRPLVVSGRIHNATDVGTAGHALASRDVDDGLIAGETVWLAGLRQIAGAYRTNINLSNLGAASATATITLFDANGNQLAEFTREVPPRRVIQAVEPYAKRGRKPYLGWGFARVTLEEGHGVFASASVINCHSNDAIMVPMER